MRNGKETIGRDFAIFCRGTWGQCMTRRDVRGMKSGRWEVKEIPRLKIYKKKEELF